MAIHDIGDVVTLWAVFRDEDGAQTDPTTVTLSVRDPQGNVTDAGADAAEAGDEEAAEAATGETLTGVTGVYRADLPVTLGGRWRYRWDATGDIAESETGSFYARRDLVGEIES